MNTSANAGDQDSTIVEAQWFGSLFAGSSDPARILEARLRLASSIMESTSDGILVTDEHGTIISTNASSIWPSTTR